MRMPTRTPMKHVRLGQHILRDALVAEKIVDTVGVSAGDLIVEIGPGTGALTQLIVTLADEVGAKVRLVEIDAEMCEVLERTYSRCDHVEVFRADARHLDILALIGNVHPNGYKVVGNLPYYAGTPIVRRFLEFEIRPTTMTVMLQREVALKMVAKPGRMSLVSLAVQIYAVGTSICDVDPLAFVPPPKVRSAVIKLVPFDAPAIEPRLIDAVFTLARMSFRGNRKQLHNSLSSGLGINVEDCKNLGAVAGLDTSRRPATLSVEEWRNLAETWLATYSEDRRQTR